MDGGEGEIRTPGPRKGSTVFETAAIDHSATSPRQIQFNMARAVRRLATGFFPSKTHLKSVTCAISNATGEIQSGRSALKASERSGTSAACGECPARIPSA